MQMSADFFDNTTFGGYPDGTEIPPIFRQVMIPDKK